ncbi:MAG: Npun_R2821/Npun_R2822 family protein [Cyanobacteria bacterium J06649_4]
MKDGTQLTSLLGPKALDAEVLKHKQDELEQADNAQSNSKQTNTPVEQRQAEQRQTERLRQEPHRGAAKGIYILANDYVLDQLIALIHSIEENVSADIPICVVPYDDNVAIAKAATESYPQVQWFDDADILAKWETFSTRIWEAHPTAFSVWATRGVKGVGRMGMHRRFCCFDGPFEKFIYLDADILAMDSFDLLFDSLDEHDFVTYDFQYKDLSHVYDVNASNLTAVFERDRLETEIFCAGLYASKKGAFSDEMLDELLTHLQAGDAEILYFNGPDQAILNYMVMKSGIDAINLSRTLPAEQRTGCCVTSPHFVEEDHVLFDHQQQLIYLHYIGVGSRFFRRVCEGENILFPYRDLFLYYRYLREETQPVLSGPAVSYDRPELTRKQRVARKLKGWAAAFTNVASKPDQASADSPA